MDYGLRHYFVLVFAAGAGLVDWDGVTCGLWKSMLSERNYTSIIK